MNVLLLTDGQAGDLLEMMRAALDSNDVSVGQWPEWKALYDEIQDDVEATRLRRGYIKVDNNVNIDEFLKAIRGD